MTDNSLSICEDDPELDAELLGWLRLAESAFDFWDNEDDAIYDEEGGQP